MRVDPYSSGQIYDIFGINGVNSNGKSKKGISLDTPQGDTVSFSEQGIALAKMYMDKKLEQEKLLNGEDEETKSKKSQIGESAANLRMALLAKDEVADTQNNAGSEFAASIPPNTADMPDTAGAQGQQASASAKAGTGGGPQQTEDELDKIDKQIEALEKKLAAVYASEIPEETKDGVASGIRAEIAALAAQKNAIVQERAKGSKA